MNEPYEFYGKLYPSSPLRLRYRCYRGKCNGMAIQVADRNTHNNYHNHVDNGLSNPYVWDDGLI